ncbi:DNA-binding MarR family transcriptional regulator [Hamadaea flava]|uniref:MarR family transcriptional regulator n=1 Tax=Hamadaea flava TaxID=1742688 RepID=A0ABV8LWW1_9ACTN|nr:MarR family transcriptional regulator [Hamadaea flava]MCP2321720.1 DNA-binding MarR family transcriptional regulator [Hamadaea flava]
MADKVTPDEQVAEIEGAMVALRRAQRRRALARLSERAGERDSPTGRLPDSVFELLDAVAAAAGRGETLTVSEAATLLDVDQPRASRLTALALEAALLRRRADQRDGRRSLLVLTEDGEAVLRRIQQFRRGVVAMATRDWPAADRAALARLLPRLVADFAAIADAGRDEE